MPTNANGHPGPALGEGVHVSGFGGVTVAQGTSVASAVPTDVASAKQVIRNALQSSSGIVRLTTQAGTAAEVGALALLANSTDAFSATDVALFSRAGITGLSSSDGANFAGTTTAETDDDVFTTSVAHGLIAGNRIVISAITQVGGTIPAISTEYFVIASGLGATTFKVSTTRGGSTINVGAEDTTAATWHQYASSWAEACDAIAAS